MSLRSMYLTLLILFLPLEFVSGIVLVSLAEIERRQRMYLCWRSAWISCAFSSVSFGAGFFCCAFMVSGLSLLFKPENSSVENRHSVQANVRSDHLCRCP